MGILCKQFEYKESYIKKNCKFCNKKGNIEIFRNDIEEFELIKCICVK